MVAVVCFLSGRAKDLSAPPCTNVFFAVAVGLRLLFSGVVVVVVVVGGGGGGGGGGGDGGIY